MPPSNVPIHGQILVEIGQDLLRAGGVPPVAHEIAHDGEHAHELHARLLHAGVCRVAHELGIRAAGLDVCEDGVALCAQGEGEEGGAHVGGDAGDNDLLLAGCADGGAEVGVVPCAAGRLGRRERKEGEEIRTRLRLGA